MGKGAGRAGDGMLDRMVHILPSGARGGVQENYRRSDLGGGGTAVLSSEKSPTMAAGHTTEGKRTVAVIHGDSGRSLLGHNVKSTHFHSLASRVSRYWMRVG